MLCATALRTRLGRREVLQGIDLAARPGTLTAIVGPNGSGKTTLLRALTGDLPPGGRVTLDGRDIATMTPADLAERRAVLPQASRLAFPFTALEVVTIGLHRGAAGGRAPVALAALARVGLAGHADRPVQDLSGGEQQRVQLARALAQVWDPVADGRPRWLFLDEPVSALDIGHQVAVMDIARGFADAGGGVVAVMHDLNLTASHADQVLVLAGGRVLARGAPAEVLTSPVLSAAYGCGLEVGRLPAPGVPFVLPQTVRVTAGG